MMLTSIEKEIRRQTKSAFEIINAQPVSGGDINQAMILTCKNKTRWFIKTNQPDKLDMFAAEALGLSELRKANAIKVPRPVCSGVTADVSFLLLNTVDLSGSANSVLFGEQLAQLHRYQNDSFGLEFNNTIGSTPQINTSDNNWVHFFKKYRIQFQLDLAMSNGAQASLLDKGGLLLSQLDIFFSNYQPSPALLHGDLWSGNWGGDRYGNPVIYDPAVYYGDHEADLAMMELFGHPGANFFSAYKGIFPIDEGYSVRKKLYNLYHIINHFNLFSGGYGAQAERIIDQLLSEIH